VDGPDASRCTVCGSRDLRPHLRVAGEAGAPGLIPTTDRFGTALADIVRCGACGHMQLARFPAGEELAEAYGDAASDDYVGEEAGQRATAAAALARIEGALGPGRRRIADLGCWVGFVLAVARDRGWEGVGVEPSAFASGYARDVLGLDVRTADLFDAGLEPGSYDAVVMGDVIEHLVDPGAALDAVAELLRPGGVVWLALPDAGSRLARALGRRWWSVIPTHVQYFTRASLLRLLGDHGYQPLWAGTAPKAFTVEYYLGRVGGYSPALARALVASARRTGVAHRLWAPDFRDRMAVLARRRGDTT
jgi:SAM-dependent methyltransferase